MTDKKASINSLEDLHNKLATVLKDAIANGVEVMNKEGEMETETAPVALLNVARQFLKDNHIESTGQGDSPLAGLAESLPFQDGEESSTIQ